MEPLQDVFVIVALGITVEALVETFKLLFVKGKISRPVVTSMVIGVLLALTVNFDWLVFLGLNPVFPYVGVVVAGLVFSRGGNFAHDLFKRSRGEEKSVNINLNDTLK